MTLIQRACAAFVLGSAAWSTAQAFDGWRELDSTPIPSKGGSWDYVAVDAQRGRLFIGHRKEGLQVFDVAKRQLLRTIDGTVAASSNGAALIPEFDLGVSYNENGTLTPFKLSTLEAGAPIKLGDALDSAHYDPVSKRLVVNMAPNKTGGTDLIVLEVPALKSIGSIPVSSRKPEHAEADDRGFMYMAARDESKVYKLDVANMKVAAVYPTPGCGQTNGLAMDTVNRRVFLGCRGDNRLKPSFAVMNADTGAIVFTHEIGGGNDDVLFDPALKRIFVTGGLNAALHVFEQVGPDAYKPVEVLGTRSGARVMTYDPKAQRLYSVTAEGSADFGQKINTVVSPYYANRFFPDTFTVLTYGKR